MTRSADRHARDLLDRWIESMRDDGYQLVETHISQVLIGPEDVFKLKKPVDLGFLDFTTLEKRRRACRAEIELNRRLAREVYLGTEPLTEDRRLGRLELGGKGDIVEWTVHMRALSDRCRGDVMLREGRLGRREIEHVSELLASFHASCREDELTRRFGTFEAIRRNVVENFEQTRGVMSEFIDPDAAAEIETWQLAFLDARRQQIHRRVQDGRIRDGHGDLRLEHVYFPGESSVGSDRVVVLDCIEFNDRFRYADVASDVAFLAMDIASEGSVELAEHLLAEYARHSNDYGIYPMVDFYESYRAFVRGKIDALTLAGTRLDYRDAERLRRRARRHFLLSHASERRSIQDAKLVAVGGWIASGKSTIAEQLAAELQCPIVAADWTRKHLVGLEPTKKAFDPAFTGAYSADVSERVYEELLARAKLVIDSGRSVIVDASFRSREERSHVRRLASELGVLFLFVECRADLETCRQRLRQRALGPSVSDGRLEILDAFVESWEAVEELPPGQHLVLDTSRSLVESTSRLRQSVHEWLPSPASKG